MIKVEEEQKLHFYILLNAYPEPWEQRHTPITRDKARELEKAKKKGKMPNKFSIIEFGYNDFVEEDGFCQDWAKKEFDDIRKKQKFMSSFLDDIIPLSSIRVTA